MYKVHVWSEFDKCYNPISGVHHRLYAERMRKLGYIVICVPFNYTQN